MTVNPTTPATDLTRVYAWFSALIAADFELLDHLLAHGVPIDVPHPLRHSTALMEATRLGRPEIVHWLLDRGAAPAFLGGMPQGTALHCAIRLHHWPIAKTLIEAMPSLNQVDSYGCTPLHALCREELAQEPASSLESFSVARALILKQCPLEAHDKDGATALHHCVINDLPNIAELLLIHGANANALIPDTSVSPLAIAALEKNLPMATLLLRHGADPYLKIHDGSSPASIHPGIVRIAGTIPMEKHN